MINKHFKSRLATSTARQVLRLEYIIEDEGSEPYEQTLELPISEYTVGFDPEVEIPGRSILALEAGETDGFGMKRYNLYRVKSALPIDIVDDLQIPPRSILFKIRWRGLLNVPDATAAYMIFSGEIDAQEISDNPDDLQWKYVVKEVEGQYHLIHMRSDGAGNVTPCEVLERRGVICKNTKSLSEYIECKIQRCPTGSILPRWMRTS